MKQKKVPRLGFKLLCECSLSPNPIAPKAELFLPFQRGKL